MRPPGLLLGLTKCRISFIFIVFHRFSYILMDFDALYLKNSVLYLTYNATAVIRSNGIFGSGVTFAPGVGTIHLDSFGAVKKLFTIFDFGTPKIGFSRFSWIFNDFHGFSRISIDFQ